MTNVLIVEDSRVSRELFERQLEAAGFHVIAAIENAANAEIACMTNQVDLILMDVCTADDESGLTAAFRIKKNYPAVKIIVMTSMPEYSFIKKAVESGCESFWYKEHGTVSLQEICRRTMEGERVWPEIPPVVMIGLARSDDMRRSPILCICRPILSSTMSGISCRNPVSGLRSSSWRKWWRRGWSCQNIEETSLSSPSVEGGCFFAVTKTT